MILVGLVALVLSGCADDSSGHQFANQPQPGVEEATPATPEGSALLPTNVPRATPVAIADVLGGRGAPNRIYYQRGDELWTLDVRRRAATRVLSPPPGGEIVAFTSSPAGDRVAVLVTGLPDGGGQPALLLLDALGGEIRRSVGLGRELGTELRDPLALDWSPQGDQILVGFRSGRIASFPTEQDGVPALLTGPGIGAPSEVAWSPTGESIAFVVASSSGGGGTLYVSRVRTQGTPTLERLEPEPAASGAVQSVAWLPNGRSLLFTEQDSELGSNTTDLWSITADGSGRRVVASAGIAAPVARVTAFAPSVDGRGVAYAVEVSGEDGSGFGSLWVRDLESGRNFNIQIPQGSSVRQLWWTSAGLVIQAVGGTLGTPSAGQAESALLLASTVAQPSELLRFAVPVAATPPAANAAATPVGPDGSPAATPAEG